MLYLEILIVLVLIVVNGLLAMSELAVVSSRAPRLRILAERGVRGAEAALALNADPGRFLSSVQIGITLVGVLSGAFSGATLGQRLAEVLGDAGLPNGIADAIGVGLVVAIITYLSLVAGELVPKQLALRDPEAIAARVAPAMRTIATIAAPIVWLLDLSSRLLLRLLGKKEEAEARVTEEEIKTLVAEAESAGVLEPEERRMISGVLRLGDRAVRGVMTPRQLVEVIDLTEPPAEIRRRILSSGHSRLPVHAGDPDEVVGIVQAKDLLDAYLSGKEPDPKKFVRDAPVIPDTTDALDVVQTLKHSPVHIGLVHDEYGHFQGVVTTADILEAIAGVFRTEETVEPNAVRRADGSWLVSGLMPADEMADLLSIELPQGRDYETAAGFALDVLGRLPQTGESFAFAGCRFEIVDLDGFRIDKMIVVREAR